MKIGTGTAFGIAIFIHLALIVVLVVNVSLDKPERPNDNRNNIMHATMITPASLGNPNGKTQEQKTQASQNVKTPEPKSSAKAQEELQERLAAQQKAEAERKEAVALKKKQEAERLEAERKANEQKRIEAEKKALALKKAQEQKRLEEQKKLEEKKKAEAEAKKKAEAETKKKAEAETKKKAEAEAKKKAEAEAKKKAEAEAKKKAEAEAKRKAEAEAQQKADSLEDDILGTTDGDPINGKGLGAGPDGAGGYGAKVQGMIEQNWLIDPSMNGKTVKVSISVDSNGLISGEQCQGDKKVCKSALDTLNRIGMLPRPPANCPECGNIVISMTPKL